MSQTAELVETLKRELRKHHITYKQISTALNLSEASIKRMFSQGQFTMDRIEAICALVDWDWIDLAESTKEREKKIDGLTIEQEAEIAQDIELLMAAVAAINGFTFQEILEHYKMPENTCIQKLAQLDRLKLIELLPGNRIKLKIAPNFRWKKGGPIQEYFLDVVAKEFFNSTFTGEREKLVVVNATLSDSSHKLIRQKMDKLAAEMSQAMRQDAHLPTKDKKGNTLVLALRHWSYKSFDALYQ